MSIYEELPPFLEMAEIIMTNRPYRLYNGHFCFYIAGVEFYILIGQFADYNERAYWTIQIGRESYAEYIHGTSWYHGFYPEMDKLIGDWLAEHAFLCEYAPAEQLISDSELVNMVCNKIGYDLTKFL